MLSNFPIHRSLEFLATHYKSPYDLSSEALSSFAYFGEGAEPRALER